MSMYVGENRIRQTRFLEEYDAPLSDVLGATAEESLLFSPFYSLLRSNELTGAEQGERTIPAPRGFGAATPPARTIQPTPLVTADEARKRIKDEGLDLTVPDEGIREGALKLLMERKAAERKRQDVLNRAPSGVGVGTLRLTTALATSLLDPLNVASAFVPVVGPTRYSMMLARAAGPLGRAGVRAGVGAVEGAAGAALVEPIIFTAAMREQADYDMADSLLNVAFGTVLGGGLHVGAGFVGDLANPAQWRTARATEAMPQILERVAPGTREAALRTAVAQAAEGRVIDIEPLIRMDPATRRQELRSGAAVVEPGRPVIAEPPEQAVPADIAVVERPKGSGMFDISADGKNIGTAGLTSADGGPFLSSIVLKPEFQGKGLGPRIYDTIEAQIGHKLVPSPLGLSTSSTRLWQRRLAAMTPDAREAAIEASRAEGRKFGISEEHLAARLDVLREPLPPKPRIEDADMVREAAARSQRPESSRLADFLASQDAEAKFQEVTKSDELETIEADLADTMQQVQDTARALEAEDRVKAALEPFDELIATAESYGKAVRAAALCQLRRG